MRRPLTGALLGVVIGVAIAVLIQQHGIWPLDKLGVFLLPAITGLVGLLATTAGRVAPPGPRTPSSPWSSPWEWRSGV